MSELESYRDGREMGRRDRQGEIERLQTAHRQLQAIIDRLGNENAKLRACLEWLDIRGGLGLDVHERIRNILNENKQDDAKV